MNRGRIVIFAVQTLVAAGVWAESCLGQAMAISNGDVPATRPADVSPLERANADAVARLELQIAAERVDDATNVGQLLDRVEGRPILESGLADAEQVGGPRYVTDDLVQVQRQMSGAKVATLIRQAVDAAPAKSTVPHTHVDALLARLDGRTFASTGTSDRARAAASGDPHVSARTDSTGPAIGIPDHEPLWASDPIVTAAQAPATGSKLRTARAAERQARAALRARVEHLKLDDQHTIADLAAANASASDLIGRAIDNARVSGVDYEADGSVEVRVALDGQRLWQVIQLAR